MRVKGIAVVLALVHQLSFAGQVGDYCVIPKLTPGIPTHVDLEYIDKPFCGVALVEGHYQKLSEITKRTIEGAVFCKSDSACQKIVRYFPDAGEKNTPFIIIFKGPKSPTGT